MTGEISVAGFRRLIVAGAATFWAVNISVPSLAADPEVKLYRPESAKGVNLQVQGGFEATVSFWPATFIFDGAHGGICTATAVGPRVLLTAAHCVTNGGGGKIVKTNAKLKCWHHDRWAIGPRWDLALCLANKDIKLDITAPYETISIAAGEPVINRFITLLGYGCTVAGGSKGVLYQGDSPVTHIASAPKPWFTTTGPVAVCSGDSGGGAFLVDSASTSRRIVGVASMMTGSATSDFAATPDADAVRWFGDWAAARLKEGHSKNELRICGLDGTLNVCHG